MDRLALHVGLPKSGTTYLQTRLIRNAASLGERGVLVPVAPREQGRGSLAFRAALDLTGRRLGRSAEYVEGRWASLAQQVGDHAGPAVISHEAFARCDHTQAERAVADLGRDHDLHVVVTARDPGRLLVSAWLEGLKHGTTHDLDEHLRRAGDGALPVWRTLDLPAVLAVWRAALPAERLHVVTVPPRGGSRGELWPRFCRATGVPVDAAPLEPRRANESLGVPEAQLMLAVNRLLGADAARGGRFHRLLSRVVAPRLAARSTVPVDVPESAAAWVAGLAKDWLDWLAEHDVDVVGDAADLRPALVGPDQRIDPQSVHPDVAAAAADVVQALLENSVDAAEGGLAG